MEGNSKIERKEVPQIHSKTGISQDYINQISAIFSFLKARGIDFVKNILKNNPINIQKYEEVYSGYKNVVNDKNRERVKKLDELSVQMNEMFKDPDSINEDVLRSMCNEMYFLVYGDRSVQI